jgi:CrcB protein
VTGFALACSVAAAGGIGATVRYITDRYVTDRLLVHLPVSDFPVGTVTVNMIGSLILGFVVGLLEHHHVGSPVELIVGTGFCGGLTTFSSASFETVRLIGNGEFRLAATNAIGGVTVCCCLAAAGLGLATL